MWVHGRSARGLPLATLALLLFLPLFVAAVAAVVAGAGAPACCCLLLLPAACCLLLLLLLLLLHGRHSVSGATATAKHNRSGQLPASRC